MFGESVPRLVAEHRRDFGLVGQRGAGVDPVGHELKQGFPRSRSGEGRDELAVHWSLRLDDPLGNHVFPGHQMRGRMGLSHGMDRQGPARLLVARQRLGAEHSVLHQERERRTDLGMKVVAALWCIGGRLDVEIGLGFQLPGCPYGLGNVLEPCRFGDRDGQIVEPIGQVFEGRRIVDHRRRHLVGRGLPLVAGLGLVPDPKLLDVDADLAVGPLALPIGERGPRPVHDRGRGHDGERDDGETHQPGALAGQSALFLRSGGKGPQLGPGKFWSTFANAHGSVSARRGQRSRAFHAGVRECHAAPAARSSHPGHAGLGTQAVGSHRQGPRGEDRLRLTPRRINRPPLSSRVPLRRAERTSESLDHDRGAVLLLHTR